MVVQQLPSFTLCEGKARTGLQRSVMLMHTLADMQITVCNVIVLPLLSTRLF